VDVDAPACERGGEVVVHVVEGSVKDRLVRRREAFTLVVQDEEPAYGSVGVEGPLSAAPAEATRQAVAELAGRHHQGDTLTDYLESIRDLTLVGRRMRPERWFAADQL
jgi:hypothetical protein